MSIIKAGRRGAMRIVKNEANLRESAVANVAVRWMMTRQGEPLVRAEFNPFPPGPDEVVVEIAGCGVCHTDLGYYYDGVRTKHDLPLTLGHEISGHVVDAGADAISWIGPGGHRSRGDSVRQVRCLPARQIHHLPEPENARQ